MSSELRQGGASRVVRLTRRGLVVGFAGVVVLTLGYAFHRTELLFLGWFAVLLPVTAALYVTLRRVRMEVARSFSHPMPVVGRPTLGQLEVRNLSGYASADARWHEVLPWHPLSTEFEPLAAIPGRSFLRSEQRTLRYTITPPGRGRFFIGPVSVELSDPFVLARSEVVVGGTQLITVIPDIENLSDSGLSVTADDGSARVQRLRALGGDDDTMTREYRTGDALRRVHWRASAHRGELMVREEEQRSHAEARVILDTIRRGYPDRQRAPQSHPASGGARLSGLKHSEFVQSALFEWTLKVAATLAMHLEQRGFLVQLMETGPRQLAPPDRVDEFLESVAAIGLTSAAEVFHSATPSNPRPDRSLGVVFAVIADAEPATLDSLIIQRPQFGFAVAFVATPGSHDATARLTRAGWHCVAAPPAESVLPLWQSIAPLLESSHARR